MLKQSDCNNCGDRNCRVYGSIRFECKSWKPNHQPLARLGDIAWFTNAQGLYNTLAKCKLVMPKEA